MRRGSVWLRRIVQLGVPGGWVPCVVTDEVYAVLTALQRGELTPDEMADLVARWGMVRRG